MYVHVIRDSSDVVLGYEAFGTIFVSDPCTEENVSVKLMNIVNPRKFQITRDNLDSVNPKFLTSFMISFTDEANFDTSEQFDMLEGSYMPCGAL